MVQESTHIEGFQQENSTNSGQGEETVMKFAVPRSSPLFATIAVIAVLSFTFVSAQAQAGSSDGAALYKAKCAMCHGPDGTGKTPVGAKLNVRDLRSPEVQKQSDSDLAQVVGQGKGKMPAFGKTLNDEQIKSLVVQIHELGKK
jgi:mono/diheme cytochrome c family protein